MDSHALLEITFALSGAEPGEGSFRLLAFFLGSAMFLLEEGGYFAFVFEIR